MLGEAVKPAGLPAACGEAMKELLRTNDLVRLSWVQALLADAGIETFVLDQNTAAIEGGIVALQRRIMVRAEDHGRALTALAAAGEAPA
jgi:hypothetical protein